MKFSWYDEDFIEECPKKRNILNYLRYGVKRKNIFNLLNKSLSKTNINK